MCDNICARIRYGVLLVCARDRLIVTDFCTEQIFTDFTGEEGKGDMRENGENSDEDTEKMDHREGGGLL